MSTEEVTASLNYVSTASAEAAREWDLLNPDFRGFMPLIETACDVQIHNARTAGSDFQLGTSSFGLAHFNDAPLFSELDFMDNAEVKKAYYPAIQQLVRKMCGFDFVAAVGHVVRSEGTGGSGGVGRKVAPHHDVHNDFTAEYKSKLISYLTPGSKYHRRGGIQAFDDPTTLDLADQGGSLQELLLADCEFSVINAWRPISHWPLQRCPLAVCDARSISHNDLVTTNFPEYNGVELQEGNEYFSATHSDTHQWYYYPQQQETEVLLFKTFDSAAAATPHAYTPPLHSAFDLPPALVPRGTSPRESCEVRLLCIQRRKTSKGVGARL
jgi:hypothetical protein